ncbi:hypothetical protein AGMMS49546_02880 [Spirochaetia bacterium]|nr:hypothetical protein AGMMS49546_02880 [Spirochaetia bacterium]
MIDENASVLLDSSSLQALKKMPVDIFDGVYVGEVKDEALVLCIDIRNFSNFLCGNDEDTVFKLLKEFSSNFLSCVNQIGYHCSYYKLLGDGALVIWDTATADHVNEALLVFSEFLDFLNEELFLGTSGLGLAGALVMEKIFKYEISAEASGLKYRDYVGYAINLACRLQTLATKDQLMLNKKLTATGILPFIENLIPELHHHLERLKGLQEDDRVKVYMYKRDENMAAISHK